MQLITTSSATIHVKESGSDVITDLTLPTGVVWRGYRTSFVRTRRASVLNGRFDPGLVWFDHVEQLRKLGMTGPTDAPVFGSAGVGVINAVVIYYYAFLEKSGTSELHESNISLGSNMLTFTNSAANVTVPGSVAVLAIEPRTTHIRIYRSDDGDTPKRVGEVAVGTTVFNDNIASDARGIEVPVYADGAVIEEGRTPPGFARLVVHYFRRVVYAGFPDNPHRAGITLLDEPESLPPGNIKDTLGREAITALGTYRDQILIFCSNVIYEMQGYDEDDFVIRKLVDGIGCIAPHSVAYDDWGRVWFMTQIGAFMYDGMFHHMMRDLSTYVREQYEGAKAAYEDCIGYIDKRWKTYNVLIPAHEGTETTWYIGAIQHLDPASKVEGGSDQPAWSFDLMGRSMTAAGILVEGENQEQVYLGGLDGVLYKANIDDDADDAGDDLEKEIVVVTGHMYSGDQASGYTHGSTMVDLTLHVLNDTELDVTIYSGSDKARDAVVPTWGPFTFPATETIDEDYVDEPFIHIRPRGVTGKGHTVELTTRGSTRFEYRGITPQVGAGAHSRAAK